jgi:lipoate-protein ligase A
MEALKDWRLLLTGFNHPYDNMAIDEAIFRECMSGNSLPTLRIYGWQPEGFSLGCSQDACRALNIGKCAEYNLPFVRRFSGGEVIFHSREVTYSISCPRGSLGIPAFIKESFKFLGSFLIDAYKSLGLDPVFSCQMNKDNPLNNENASAFCFASKEDYDIIIKGRKIGGNAQRRIKDAVFQHGSIPLKLDIDRLRLFLNEPLADISKKTISLEVALGRDITFAEFAERLKTSFGKVFSVNLVPGGLTSGEKELISVLKEEKYANPDWNLYRKKTVLAQ